MCKSTPGYVFLLDPPVKPEDDGFVFRKDYDLPSLDFISFSTYRNPVIKQSSHSKYSPKLSILIDKKNLTKISNSKKTF